MPREVSGKHFTEKVFVSGESDVSFRNCLFTGSSLRFNNCDNPQVKNCTFVNSIGGHAVQFIGCRRGSVEFSNFDEPIGASKLSDIVNIFKSSGTKEQPITIKNNYIKGGGPSTTGGGIMLGDNMGDLPIASDNILVNCGQYGIAIAGGANNVIADNKVMGEKFPWTNAGIYVWGVPQRGSHVKNATVSGNVVHWKKKSGVDNSWWKGANTENVVLSNNTFNAPYVAVSLPANVGATSTFLEK